MKYRYRNRKTGEEVITSNRIGGKNWAPVEELQQTPADETHEEVAMNETLTAAPVEKPKTASRGKK